MRKLVQQFRRRPALLLGTASGLAAALAASYAMRGMSAGLLGWCLGVTVYLISVLATLGRSSQAEIKKRADELDEGRGAMLVFTVAATLISMVALVFDLAQGQVVGLGSAVLAGATVILSWTFVHVVFALHYAHDYYLAGGGLKFAGESKPLYWDFVYVAFTIGMTAQVSDTATASLAMRRLVLVHGILSFFFNTAILALGVNLAASLLR